MVFTDYDPPGTVDPGEGDAVLRVFAAAATRDTVQSTSTTDYVSFTRTGTAKFADAAASEVKFKVMATPCDNEWVRTVSVTNLGRSASKADICP